MTRLLIDTSAYSAFLRGHAAVVDEISHADLLFANPVVLGELLAGFRQGTRRERNLELLRRFTASPRFSLLPIDEETAERYAVIYDGLRRAGTPAPTNDLWIAATAMQHGLRVITTDRHFTSMPQIVASYHAV